MSRSPYSFFRRSLRSISPRQTSRDRLVKASAAAVRAAGAIETLERRQLLTAVSSIEVANIGTAGGTNHTINVTYTADAPIASPSINTGDINVLGPNGGSLSVINAEVLSEGTTLVARYTFTARGGSWDSDDNGQYTVQVKEGEVIDTVGAANAAAASNFSVSIPAPDTEKPNSQFNAANITAGGGTNYDIAITYTDNNAINTGSIGADDITVSHDGQNLTVTGVTVTGSGGNVVATYHVTPPGGSWDSADNGGYSVNLLANAVTDAAGNGVNAKSDNFNVNITAPDTAGPQANIDANNPAAGGTSYSFTIEYTDDTGVAANTIGTDDVTVTGPGGPIAITGVQTQSSQGGRRVVATYTLTPPGGSWGSEDNGAYTVALAAGAVTDTAGNAVAGAQDTFSVNVLLPDLLPPSATLNTTTLTTAGATATLVVTYTDDRGMDPNSVGTNDVTVVGAAGNAPVTSVSTESQDGGKVLVVTYTLGGPGGSWDTADNGAYVVTVPIGAVTDGAGNPVLPMVGALNVNISAADTQAPTATVNAGNVTGAGSSHTITVTYADNAAINASSISTSDIIVTGPAGPLQVTGVSKSPNSNAATVTATYTVAAPGGSWDAGDNGNYTVQVVAGEVTDAAGNAVATANGGFSVTAGPFDNGGPSAAISAAPITTQGTTNQIITVVYTDDVGVDTSTIGDDDIAVNGPAGALSIAAVVVNSSDNNKTVTATYTIAAPQGGWTFSHNGDYTIEVRPGRVRDLAGNAAATTTGAFTVAIAPPTPVDGTFNGGAGVTSDFTTEAIATQNDGMILVAGRQGAPGNSRGVIRRLTGNGTVDTSFGSGGTVLTGANGNDAFYAMVLQGDKILVAGSSNGDFLLVRYDLAGNLDTTFGQNGRVVTDLGSDADAVYGMALAPDGKIVLAGGSSGNFAFARFEANGAIDLGFAQAGKQLFDLGSATDVPGAVVVQSDGKIIAAGSSGKNVALVRLRADGEADNTFSGDALLFVTGLESREDNVVMDRSQALALQSDGKILISNHTASGDVAVARVDGSGNLDSSFGNNGIATADFGGEDDGDALLVQDTGEILVVGTSLDGVLGKTAVAAFTASGQLIQDFGEGGKLTLSETTLPRELHVGDLVLRAYGARQNDGRVVVGSSNQAPQSTGGSSLTRLIVPGTRSQPQGSAVGSFGIVNGKNQRLSVTDNDGTVLIFSVKNGTGTVFQNGDKINLVITDSGRGAAVKVKAKGGNGRVTFGDVIINGALKSLSCKTADLTGTLSASTLIGKLTLGDISGLIAAGASITSLSANSLTNARVLAGAGLGSDRHLGGTAGDTDTFAAGSIGKIAVRGSITGSLIGAGLNPVDGTFGDNDDIVIGGPASFIKSITAKTGADDSTQFVAGSFKSAKLGGKVSITTDPRFKTLA